MRIRIPTWSGNCWKSSRLIAVGAVVATSSPALTQPNLTLDQLSLVRALEQKGFTVLFEHPPKQKAYGLFLSKSKELYISPLAFELGIGQAVFVHEAIHAAQSCPSGTLTSLGWKPQKNRIIAQEISGIVTRSYHANQHLEREAFHGQAQENAIPRVINALKSRCP